MLAASRWLGGPGQVPLTSLCLLFLLSDRANCTHGGCLSFLDCLEGNEAGRRCLVDCKVQTQLPTGAAPKAEWCDAGVKAGTRRPGVKTSSPLAGSRVALGKRPDLLCLSCIICKMGNAPDSRAHVCTGWAAPWKGLSSV